MEYSQVARHEVALAMDRTVGWGLPRLLPYGGAAAHGFTVCSCLMLSGGGGTPQAAASPNCWLLLVTRRWERVCAWKWSDGGACEVPQCPGSGGSDVYIGQLCRCPDLRCVLVYLPRGGGFACFGTAVGLVCKERWRGQVLNREVRIIFMRFF